MAKKSTPIITHTEILNRAIFSIKREIAEWHDMCEVLPQPERDEVFNKSTMALHEKLVALKEMYRIETGEEYR